jgi:hypothetical protein
LILLLLDHLGKRVYRRRTTILFVLLGPFEKLGKRRSSPLGGRFIPVGRGWDGRRWPDNFLFGNGFALDTGLLTGVQYTASLP